MIIRSANIKLNIIFQIHGLDERRRRCSANTDSIFDNGKEDLSIGKATRLFYYVDG